MQLTYYGSPFCRPANAPTPQALVRQLAGPGPAAGGPLGGPAPAGGDCYFDGGYTVLHHGSRNLAGPLDAVQAETNYTGVRGPGAAARHRAGTHLALALGDYLRTYYRWQTPRP